VQDIKLQKLFSPNANDPNIKLKVKFALESPLAAQYPIFHLGDEVCTLHDDGANGDEAAGDHIYVGKFKTNLQEFTDWISYAEGIALANGAIGMWHGHSAVTKQFLPSMQFNLVSFNNGTEVNFEPALLSIQDCNTDLLKQNSLFITDLAVVEDPARTYKMETPNNPNITDVPARGNPNGCWTFGQMIKNIANEPLSGVSAKAMIKAWMKSYLVTQNISTVGNTLLTNIGPGFEDLQKRPMALRHLIAPWIARVHPNGATLPNVEDILSSGGTSQSAEFNAWMSNWENWYDDCDENDLLQNAPFRLMAIINRIDLRGKAIFAEQINNAGETRFIYTLIDPNTGMPPEHDNIQRNYGPASPGATDWVGMNVILEYRNPIHNMCALQQFGWQWANLSDLTLGSTQYNDALQVITDRVTSAGAAGSANLNGSALSQMRTNEKIFDEQPIAPLIFETDWSIPDWQLRQFELNATGMLVPALCTNTPAFFKNLADGGLVAGNVADNLNINNGSANSQLVDWVYNSPTRRQRVAHGTHTLPSDFIFGSATVGREFVTYFGIDWSDVPEAVWPNKASYDPLIALSGQQLTDAQQAKEIRHQLSLNTCYGCHSGETKTNFTMVYPRGWGEAADYWSATPSHIDRNTTPINIISLISPSGRTPDCRFATKCNTALNGITISGAYEKNFGYTFEPNVNGGIGGGVPYLNIIENHDFNERLSNSTAPIVSPFITGRNFASNGSGWYDDWLNDTSEVFKVNALGNYATPLLPSNIDKTLKDFFFVNDPDNRRQSQVPNANNSLSGYWPQNHDRKSAFNELERRRIDLCQFLRKSCYGTKGNEDMVGIMFELATFEPFTPKGH
jgi:hypothetical protein